MALWTGCAAVPRAEPAPAHENPVVRIRYFQRRGSHVRASRGSGFIVHSGGYVVTNEHVVTRRPGVPSETLTVVIDEGTPGEAAYPARLDHVDKGGDIALLRILPPFRPLPALPLGTRADLQAGTLVTARGYAPGVPFRATPGVVVRILPADRLGIRREWLVSTATVRNGFSGGPLVDDRGLVLGVVARRAIWRTDEPGFKPKQEFTHAVPIDYVRRRLKTWKVPGVTAEG